MKAQDLPYELKFRRNDYTVRDVSFRAARNFIEREHYAKGGSNTFVYCHGLFRKSDDLLCGVAWWLPPTRVACESVNQHFWNKVLALSRFAILEEVPKNGASFLLSRSIRLIERERRFVELVTYADESQGHTGTIYRAAGWHYVGRTGPYARWTDPVTGRQVSQKATINRTVSEMREMGFVKTGSFHKHKYVFSCRTLSALSQRNLTWLLCP